MPCLSLMSLEEFTTAAAEFDIDWAVEEQIV